MVFEMQNTDSLAWWGHKGCQPSAQARINDFGAEVGHFPPSDYPLAYTPPAVISPMVFTTPILEL